MELAELIDKIDIWNQKYIERRNGFEPLTVSLEN